MEVKEKNGVKMATACLIVFLVVHLMILDEHPCFCLWSVLPPCTSLVCNQAQLKINTKDREGQQDFALTLEECSSHGAKLERQLLITGLWRIFFPLPSFSVSRLSTVTAGGCKTRTEFCALLKEAVVTFYYFLSFQ